MLVRHQDVAALDVPDESVDVIASNLGINNFDDPERVLRACFRMARPDATLFVTSNVIGHMAEFYEVFGATLVELGQPSGNGRVDRGHDAPCGVRGREERGELALTIAMACVVTRKSTSP